MSPQSITTVKQIAAVSRKDTEDAEAEAMNFVAGLLGNRWSPTDRPDDPRDLTGEQIADIVEGFRSKVSGNVSTGDVSINFTDIVRYACGRSTILNETQKFLIISACTVVRTRPLPVLRWVNFVLANLDNPERIRFVLTACKISKKLLASRIEAVIRRYLPDLKLPKIPQVLFMGYTKTGISTLTGMAKESSDELPVFIPEMPLQGRRGSWHKYAMSGLSDIPGIKKPELVSRDKALELCKNKQIDVVLTGCKVIGRTKSNTVEVINSLPLVELTNKAHKYGVPVLVSAGLYKIWPSEFYERNKKLTVESEYIDGELSNGFLSNDINWIITERGWYEFAKFAVEPVVQTLFAYEELEFLAALGACRDEKIFEYAIQHAERFKVAIQCADKELAGLSVYMSGEQSSESPMTMEEEYQVHPETLVYWRTRKLPEHVERARDYFIEQLNDEHWYSQYKGKYMAFMYEGNKVQFEVDNDIDQVLKKAYKKWGYRPLFATLVTREESIRIVRPRGLVSRMK